MPWLKHLAIIAGLATLFSLSVTDAHADRRVALVIGNSAYQNATQLPNPANDAAAVAALFKSVGFEVVESKHDLGSSDMRRTVREFAAEAAKADVAVVYYAGHGIEVDGTNYLIPVDAALVRDTDVEDETISLDRIMRLIEPAKKLRLVILDACRDNPFANGMKRTYAKRSLGRGLAKVEPTIANTLVAFAAREGSTAADGDAKNSPFTAALLKHLASPGLDLRIAFGRVRDEVLKNTGNQQEPFVYGSLGGEVLALVPAPVDQDADARRDYEFAAQIGTKDAWESFLAARKTGLYADLARAQYNKLTTAEQASAKADEAARTAQLLEKRKFDDIRRQAEEQAKREAEEAKRQISEQAKREIEENKRKVAEQAQRDLADARRQVEEAKRQADEARRQVDAARQQAVEDARRQVEEARRKSDAQPKIVAALPSPPQDATPAPAKPVIDSADIARLLQAHLKRVGCDPGTTDGSWGESSRKALEKFNKAAGTTYDVKVASLDVLDTVRAKSARVCPLVCDKGQKAESDRCVQITCQSGFALGSDGACHKKPEPAARSASRSEPRAAASAGGTKCFTFNGKRFCE